MSGSSVEGSVRRDCKHADFVGTNDYGSCTKFEYEHQKHSDAKRHLSIFRGGSCPDHEVYEPRAPMGSGGTL